MGLKLKASKCKSLSIVSGKAMPISFHINHTELDTLDKENHKFLGSTITFSGKQKETLKVVKDHFESRLKSIDSLLIRNEYKLKIYKDYLLPASRFILTVHNLTETSLTSLDSLVTKYLKSWLGLPSSATRGIIHAHQLIDIKPIKYLYKESQTNAYLSSRLKADRKVNVALDSRLNRESNWKRKSSTIVSCEKVRQNILDNQSTPDKSNNSTNSMNVNKIKTVAKRSLNEEMQQYWLTHLKKLVVQGQLLTIAEDLNSDFSYKSLVFDLPRNVLKFLSNACIDTLPINVNLKRWNKRSSVACKLCSNKETLLHVLNNCKTMLTQGRYTWRHNSVLNYIFHLVQKSYSDPSFKIYCDLPEQLHGISTIPTNVAVTSLKPDPTIVNETSKEIIIVELTIPFDQNINSAHQRKSKRYEMLVNDIENNGYDVKYFPIEIGSRGLISRDNVLNLRTLFNIESEKSREFKNILKNLSKISIIASYCIFYSKFEHSWIDPELITIL